MRPTEVQKPKLVLKDFGDGILPEHEMEVCNILETFDSRSFLENIISGGKNKYVVDATKTVKAYQYLSQFYQLPKYY